MNVVQFSADEEELTAKAIGSAGKLVVTLGDDGVTTQQASLIVAAAALANVSNFVLVAPSGAAGREASGFFAKLFSFFTGKGKDAVSLDDLMEQLAATEIAYTVIKSGALAGIPDTFASFSNVEIEPEGSVAAGQVTFPLANVTLTVRFCIHVRSVEPGCDCIAAYVGLLENKMPKRKLVPEPPVASLFRSQGFRWRQWLRQRC